MRFIDKQSDRVLETSNPFVIEQYQKYNDRYEPLDDSGGSPFADGESMDDRPKRGRPKVEADG